MINNESSIGIANCYVNINQASQLLFVNRATVRRWIKQGKLPTEKIGTVTLINKWYIYNIASEKGIGLQ